MAGTSRPSFTKKLREQKRLAKAAAKREARSTRRRAHELETQETPLLEAPPSPQEES